LDHKNLDIWKASTELALHIYKTTNCFPKEEIYSLTSQIRRSAVSVPSNIAEGAARNSDKEFVHFLYIALGSLSEVETQMIIAERLGYTNHSDEVFTRVSSIKQMTLGLIRHLRNKKRSKERESGVARHESNI